MPVLCYCRCRGCVTQKSRKDEGISCASEKVVNKKGVKNFSFILESIVLLSESAWQVGRHELDNTENSRERVINSQMKK